MAHFTVVCLVTWPWIVTEAGVSLFRIQTSLPFICRSCCSYAKGRTIRKVMGGGGGFSACTIFFFRPLLVQEFFLQVKPSARIFFSDKDCFVSHF